MERAWSILGLLGILLCVAGITGLWYAKKRIDGVARQVFETTSESLSRVNRRLVDIGHAVDGAKISVDEIKENLKHRTTVAAKENLSSRLELEARVERLEGCLTKAELLLNTSTQTFQDIRQTLELCERLGLLVETEFLDLTLGTLTHLQTDVQAAGVTVEDIRQRVRGEAPGIAAETGREQALQLTARLVATFGKFDKRLGQCSNRLSEAQNRVAELEAVSHSRTFVLTITATILLAWMGVGQFVLWRSGL